MNIFWFLKSAQPGHGPQPYGEPHRFLGLDELRVRVASSAEPPIIIALDGVEDPQNFGAVLRTA